jgi:predicted nucleic acid-binding protein
VHLADTNVVSEFMRPRPLPAVLRWGAHVTRFALSAVSVEEIAYGLSLKQSARLERAFEELMRDYCDVLPVTVEIARRCGALRARLRAEGSLRTHADMLIAATALEHDLVLVTRNERDFEECGLRIVNPFAG